MKKTKAFITHKLSVSQSVIRVSEQGKATITDVLRSSDRRKAWHQANSRDPTSLDLNKCHWAWLDLWNRMDSFLSLKTLSIWWKFLVLEICERNGVEKGASFHLAYLKHIICLAVFVEFCRMLLGMHQFSRPPHSIILAPEMIWWRPALAANCSTQSS